MLWQIKFRSLVLAGDLLVWALERAECPAAWKRTDAAAGWCYERAKRLCEE